MGRKAAALHGGPSIDRPTAAVSEHCWRDWLVCVGPGTEDAVALAVAQVFARRQRGILISSRGAGHQLTLRTAIQLRGRLPEATIGVHCPDLRPQDLLCRLPSEVDLAWFDVPQSTAELRTMVSAMRVVRGDYAWAGLVCGDFGDRHALSDLSSVACARDSGQFDLLACHVSPFERRANAIGSQAFADRAWPLVAAVVMRRGARVSKLQVVRRF